MSAKLSARARLAALSRRRSPDDPAVIDARRELATESIAEHIHRVVDTAPPLTDEQVDRLRGLLGLPCRCHHHTAAEVPPQRRRRAGEVAPA